jgi:hypothetical protein
MRDYGGRPSGGLGLWWGYLPLVVVAALFVGMVFIAPSEVPGKGNAAAEARVVNDAESASGWGETVSPCTDRQKQVEGDGYSPPCFAFAGDNGGATTRGVTADTVKVTYRMTSDPPLLKFLADMVDLPFDETNEDLVRTAEGLVDYFNQRFQFYGRHIELTRVEGNGTVVGELTGGGQDAAVNDALKVASEEQAFADVTALSQPYADALADQHVINLGVPYMSQDWFSQRRPYSWSSFPDCTTAAEASAEVAVKAILGRPAKYAGGDLADRDRKIGIIAPNNLEYQQCVGRAIDLIEDGGFKVDYTKEYTLDVGQAQNNARTIVSELIADGVTSVAFAGDPLTLGAMASVADQQNYHPEWLVIGVGFVDLDLVGQIIQKNSGEEWGSAFGGSPWAGQQAATSSEGYKAYKSVRQDEPSLLVDILYYQIYQLAIGLQMAGPNLTPETYETGMFAYPEGTGAAGTWDFTPGHYTGIIDIRILWWQGDTPSPWNNEPGVYKDDGTRVRQGEVPEEELKVFQ